jgi:hypothetical protein
VKDETSKTFMGLDPCRNCTGSGRESCSYRTAYRFVVRTAPIAQELFVSTLTGMEPTHSSACLYWATASCLGSSLSDPFLRSEYSADEVKAIQLFVRLAHSLNLTVENKD